MCLVNQHIEMEGTNMNKPETIYNRLDAVRSANGLTWYGFAKAIDVHTSTVYAWRHRGGEPGYNIREKNIQAIADHFDVSAEWLVEGGPQPDFEVLKAKRPAPVEGVDPLIDAINRLEEIIRQSENKPDVAAHLQLLAARDALRAAT
jgi:hypothetical protein